MERKKIGQDKLKYWKKNQLKLNSAVNGFEMYEH